MNGAALSLLWVRVVRLVLGGCGGAADDRAADTWSRYRYVTTLVP